jgi:hypothetical protein
LTGTGIDDEIAGGRETDRWRRRRREVVLAAIGLIVALVVGVLLELRGRDQTDPDPGYVAAGTPLVPGELIPADEAWAKLIAVAPLAEPVAAPEGRLIYIRTDGPAMNRDAGGVWRWQWTVLQMWLDPWDMEPVEIRIDGISIMGRVEDPAGNSTAPADLIHPTAAWLASLPTDPVTLREALLAKSSGGAWSAEHEMWESVGNLCSFADLLLPTDVRVALYQALALEEGLTARRMTLGDQELIAIGRDIRTDGQQLLFDPTTGRCVGRRSLHKGDPIEGVGPEGVRDWSVWRQTVVEAVGRTAA